MKDRDYLISMYNATSTDDESGEIETYEAWLERQLLSRIERLEQLALAGVVNRRELLLEFMVDYNKRNFDDCLISEQDVELFLKQ